MLMHNHPSRVVPRREQDPTFPAVVLHVLERAHHEGDAAEEAAEAEEGGPGAV